MFSPHSPLFENLSRVRSDAEKIEVLFLSLLNRKPSQEEAEDCLELVKKKSLIPPPALKVSTQWSSVKKNKYLMKMAEQKRRLVQSDNRRFIGVAWAIMNTRQFSFIQ